MFHLGRSAVHARTREPLNNEEQNQMTENQIFEAQKKRIYKRMGIDSILGGSIFLAAGLGLAWFGNNMNPVSGLGILVLATFGVVVGALLGTLTKPKNQST